MPAKTMAAGTKSETAFSLDDEAFSSDEFRMYYFKIKRCPQARPHDWTRCPFAHPGEKAKRRDPRKYQYSGTACPEFRKSGCCRRGDACPFAHGVFECWCHPSRYRTQICTDGTNCKRRVCFFAHLESEVRKRDESNLPLPAQPDLAAEAQIQQQEVAQAFQVLLNANAQNPGGLAGLNLMNSLAMMGQGAPGVPMNPLAERAQQLQQQLQQLQALQAMQMPQQGLSAPQMAEMQGGFDNLSLLGTSAAQNGVQQLQQAQLDQELLLGAQQQRQHQHQQQAMSSPFARAGVGSAFADAGRLGTPPLDLGHAISLPNPDALRAAGMSPGLGAGLGNGLNPASSSGFSGDSPFAANSRINALRGMQRHASLEGALPASLGALGGGGFSALGLGQRTGSGNLGVLPPGPNSSVFAQRGGSQPIGSQALGGQGLGATDPQFPLPIRPQGGRFASISGPHPFAAQQPGHGHRRSVDMGTMGRSGSGPLGIDVSLSQPLGMGSQPLHSLQEELGVDMSGVQGLSLDSRAGSGWLPQAVQQMGVSQQGSLAQALSAQGSLSQALSPAGSLQSQLAPQAPIGKPPPGSASKHGPSRLGVGSPPSAAAAAFAAAAGPGMTTASSILDGAASAGCAEPNTSAPALAVPQSMAQAPLPSGSAASATALAAARSEAQSHQNVYEALGRPPAIREDQPLVGVYGMLPRTPPAGGDNDPLRIPSYIGRNASFDRILAELPRSLSEVAMQAGHAQHQGNAGGNEGGNEGVLNAEPDA